MDPDPFEVFCRRALEQGQWGEPVLSGDQIVLFEVTEHKHFDPVEFQEQKEGIRAELALDRLGELLTSVVTDRRDEIGVSYDPQLAQNLGLDQG